MKLQKKASDMRAKLAAVGPMRPGKLTRQFKDPKAKKGAYWQLNYTYRMKSRTEYVRPESLGRIRKESGAFKKFKAMVDALIDLELRISTLKSELEKGHQ
ncbi:MAG TPA: hypothetical protein VK465_16640 [Fibrobacteria bacterium]|nr:hypothetical protein [Fibrobacteria bacterium]